MGIGQGHDFSGVIEITLGGTVTLGLAAKVQDMIGVYQKAGVSGDKVPLKIAGIVEVTKEGGTGLAWTKGDKVYYRAGGPDFTKTSTSNTYAGIAWEDAGASATTGKILLGHGVD